jgi:hypothetical protein
MPVRRLSFGKIGSKRKAADTEDPRERLSVFSLDPDDSSIDAEAPEMDDLEDLFPLLREAPAEEPASVHVTVPESEPKPPRERHEPTLEPSKEDVAPARQRARGPAKARPQPKRARQQAKQVRTAVRRVPLLPSQRRLVVPSVYIYQRGDHCPSSFLLQSFFRYDT